jgi:Na+-driven multidrug efflux pump
MVVATVLTVILFTERRLPVSLAGIGRITIEPALIRSILQVCLPSGLESSLFQIGKILVSRIFTSFGTAAIAANAISGVINSGPPMPLP